MKISLLFTILLSTIILYGQKYTLPTLPYSYNALEKYIDAATMEIHHSKHHQAYVNNLNKAITGTNYENMALEELMIKASLLPDGIRNNAGGHYNHSLFWNILTPNEKTQPKLELANAINENFKSLDSLKKLLNQAASTRFGSGWAWLVLTPEKKLAVTSTGNQDNPIMDVAPVRGIPLLGIDVWEHAYYLKYQNKRGDYLSAIWNIIDWNKVSENYDKALTSSLLFAIEQDNWKEIKEYKKSIQYLSKELNQSNYSEVICQEIYLKSLILKKSNLPKSVNQEKTKISLEKLVILSKEIKIIAEKQGKTEKLKMKVEEISKLLTALEEKSNL